jgi:hypothetical protein
MAVAAIVLAILLHVRSRRLSHPGSVWPSAALTGLGCLVFLASRLAPDALHPVYRLWMAGGRALGQAVSVILVAVVYFAVVTPVGMLMRWTGRDPLQRRRIAMHETLWHPLPAPPVDHHSHMS